MSEQELPAVYDPAGPEGRWYSFWEERGYFHADPKPGVPRFCITIPPPNVTGSLHLGHALQHSLHDLLVRWKRMQGVNTLCLPGMDHAGIATQMVVEKQLAKEGFSRHDLGREKFLERVWQWKEHYGGEILRQLRRLGCSYDWRREVFTLDPGYVRAVRTAFVRLHQAGYVYRGLRVINWCPRCQTAISDLEVRHEEVAGHLWHVRYPFADSSGHVTVATTRPETMLGDTAVAVNAKDDRYRDEVGKTLRLPLMDREIPLIADDTDYVDPQFGSGAVKVTPAHDPADFEAGQRHKLPSVTVIGADGTMTAEAGRFAGLDRFAAREAVVAALEEQGLLERVEDYPHAVGHCDRCGTMIEPLLSEQWFVAMGDLADRAIECLRREGVRYVPDRYRVLSIEWLEQIRDWCISRQLWWGHRLPVWTCAGCGKVIVQVDPPTSCPDCGRDELTQDPDVLDTWFSSALWPYATLGWPDQTPELDYFYPTDLLITDRMILWLWVARMIFTGLFFLPPSRGDEAPPGPDAPEGGIPFHTVLVHPTILNREGRRMSRTLGTGVDPVELMEKYGTDATRFGLLLQCAAGQDVRFAEERIAMSRNFCNKIWNATRFLLLNLGAKPPTPAEIETAPAEVRAAGSLADRWILSRLAAAVETVTENLGEYRPDEAARRLYDFFWSELCDWYVEISKPALRDRAEAARTRRLLSFVFETALRLLHPFLPFITEELWQRLPHQGDSIMIAPWPKAVADWRDAAAEEEMALLMEVVAGVRRLRADMAVSPGSRVAVSVRTGSPAADRLLTANGALVAGLTRAESVRLVSAAGPPAGALTHQFHWSGAEVVAWIEAIASVEELTRERNRLNKELARLSREVEGVESKLADPEFRTRAPAAVVEKVRSRQVEARAQQVGLRARLAEVESALRDAGGAVG